MIRALVLSSLVFAAPALANADELNGRVAVLVQMTDGAPALVEVVRKHYGDVAVLDAEAVRAGMAKDGETILAEARARKLRESAEADRLIVLETHTTGSGARLLQLRAFDATGASHRRNVEVTDATIAERLARMLQELPQALPRKRTFFEVAHFASSDDDFFFDVNAFGGRKMLDGGDWDELATQNEIGAWGTFGPTRWPVHLALEAYGSRAEHADTTATIVEIGGGAGRVFRFGPFRPHVAAGIHGTRADVAVEIDEQTFDTETDRGIGTWVSAGASFRVRKYANVGVHLRWSSAAVELGPRTLDAGGLHAGVSIGIGSAVPAPRR